MQVIDRAAVNRAAWHRAAARCDANARPLSGVQQALQHGSTRHAELPNGRMPNCRTAVRAACRATPLLQLRPMLLPRGSCTAPGRRPIQMGARPPTPRLQYGAGRRNLAETPSSGPLRPAPQRGAVPVGAQPGQGRCTCGADHLSSIPWPGHRAWHRQWKSGRWRRSSIHQ
jgi:hypothetical protein